MSQEAKNILSQLTLEEKASLLSGKNFWYLKGIERLDLPSIMVTDGPHGLRKQMGDSDHVGLNESVKATCFPPAVTTAASWDKELMYKIGEALGEECLQEQVSVILGPGANIKRSPLCGRNFEYISEDPLLTGEMAAALIQGVQSKGVGTSLKHYVMNNQEARRMTINAVVDPRTQREIYLRGFEIAVKKSQPWTVMCSYNRVDETYLSDHKRLLTDILKEEWGHTGLVVTDWGACNNRVEGVKAGLELEMPGGSNKNTETIIKAVQNGALSEQDLDKAVIRVIDLILKSKKHRVSGYTYNQQSHHTLARKAAAESGVLLKNNGLLPLNKEQTLAVIGEFAKKPRYQGAGSSIITPHSIDTLCDTLTDRAISYTYAAGYDCTTAQPNLTLIQEAAQVASQADIAVVVIGLTDDFESEGFDRSHINIPESHTQLLQQVVQSNPNTVVLLQNGAPITMDWLEQVPAVLECYLGGEAGAPATVDMLYGDVNPSGKLAETFPLSLHDTPSFNYFPGGTKSVEYRESIYVGYRYYDTAKKEVLFPFGHGLSYTSFDYANLNISQENDTIVVSCDVTNTGERGGAEIVQLYAKHPTSTIFKAEKELIAFDKQYIESGETAHVQWTLEKSVLSYYNVLINDWHVESGEYKLLVGASSRDIRLQGSISVRSDKDAPIPDYREIAPSYYNLQAEELKVPKKEFESIYGATLPPSEPAQGEPFTINTTLGETQHTFIGRMLMKKIRKNMQEMMLSGGDTANSMATMIDAMVHEMPIRTFGMMGGNDAPTYLPEALVALLNRKYITGLKLMRKK